MQTGEAPPDTQTTPESEGLAKLLRPRIYWPRIFAEGAAIVVSILLAFTLDAWWDRARANQEELSALRGLRADFAANAAELDRAREDTEEIQAVADSILALTGPARSPVPADHSMRLIANLLKSVPSFRPVEGTLGALLAAQGLSTISDPTLRVHLARWPNTASDIRSRADRISAYFDDLLMPYLFPRIPVRTLDALGTPEFGARQSQFPLSVEGVLREVEFENLVNEFYFNQSQLLRHLESARAATDSILQLIDKDPRIAR